MEKRELSICDLEKELERSETPVVLRGMKYFR
jgi:hypothetical protein